jgi:hypothetical protein
MIVIIEHWQGRRTMVVFPEMPVLKWCVPVCEVLLMNVERRQRAADDQGYRRDKCEDVSDQGAPHRAIMVKRLQDVNERFSGRHERFQNVNKQDAQSGVALARPRPCHHAHQDLVPHLPHWTLEHPDLCSEFRSARTCATSAQSRASAQQGVRVLAATSTAA